LRRRKLRCFGNLNGEKEKKLFLAVFFPVFRSGLRESFSGNKRRNQNDYF